MTDETTWLVDLKDMPPGDEIPGLEGVTIGDWLDFHGVRPPPPGVRFEQNVPYGRAGTDGRELLLHLFRPLSVGAPRPGILFVHGGGWAGGHPFMHLRHAHELAARGFTTATIAYRLSPEARWPAALEDAKCAVRWMRANHAELGVDPYRIGISGGSAGGHLACMVALTPGRFEGTGGHEDVPSGVQAAVVWYPMTDMRAPGRDDEQIELLLTGFLGPRDEDVIRESSPVTHVHAGAPPILTMTGDQDPATPIGMIRDFHAALDRAGAPNRLEVFEGRSHAFDFRPDEWERCLPLLTEWFGAHLRASASVR